MTHHQHDYFLFNTSCATTSNDFTESSGLVIDPLTRSENPKMDSVKEFQEKALNEFIHCWARDIVPLDGINEDFPIPLDSDIFKAFEHFPQEDNENKLFMKKKGEERETISFLYPHKSDTEKEEQYVPMSTKKTKTTACCPSKITKSNLDKTTTSSTLIITTASGLLPPLPAVSASTSTKETLSFDDQRHYDTSKSNLRHETPILPHQIGEEQLPPNFKPAPYSVIVGKGNASRDNIGNRRLRVLASIYLQRYADAAGDKKKKSNIVTSLVDAIRDACPVGAFIKLGSDDKWYAVGDNVAREKVGYTLREMLGDKYKSSSKAKAAMRTYRAEKLLQNILGRVDRYHHTNQLEKLSLTENKQLPCLE